MTLKSKVPEIRFEGFSGEWNLHEVGEFYDFKNGLNKGKEFFGYGTPIVNFTDVFHNRSIKAIKLKGKVSLTNKEITNFNVKQGDIFFTRTSETINEIGYPAVMMDLSKNTVFSGFVLRARAIKIDPMTLSFKQYVFFTKAFRSEMIKKSSMTTRALTSGTAIKHMYIIFPKNKIEQTKIGTYFQNLDSLITQHQQKHEKLLNIKKAMLEKMFPKEGADVPEIRFEGFDGEWEAKELGEIAKLGSSKRVHREDYVESGVPFFRGSEISKLGNYSKLEDILYISRAYYLELKEKYGVPQIGDILITAVGTLGNSFLVQDKTPFYFKDGNLIWMSNIQVNSNYLNIYLGDGIGQERIIDSAVGSNQKALTMVKLQSIKVSIPKSNEQTKIGNFFKKLDDIIVLQQTKLEKLKNIKKASLEKMFV